MGRGCDYIANSVAHILGLEHTIHVFLRWRFGAGAQNRRGNFARANQACSDTVNAFLIIERFDKWC
ncbi:MAG: hypothetical protein EBS62_04920 [Betaproteobacteria bacterium]|nr:hypothetical protein [Betaproteobacteria bacterium]